MKISDRVLSLPLPSADNWPLIVGALSVLLLALQGWKAIICLPIACWIVSHSSVTSFFASYAAPRLSSGLPSEASEAAQDTKAVPSTGISPPLNPELTSIVNLIVRDFILSPLSPPTAVLLPLSPTLFSPIISQSLHLSTKSWKYKDKTAIALRLLHECSAVLHDELQCRRLLLESAAADLPPPSDKIKIRMNESDRLQLIDRAVGSWLRMESAVVVTEIVKGVVGRQVENLVRSFTPDAINRAIVAALRPIVPRDEIRTESSIPEKMVKDVNEEVNGTHETAVESLRDSNDDAIRDFGEDGDGDLAQYLTPISRPSSAASPAPQDDGSWGSKAPGIDLSTPTSEGFDAAGRSSFSNSVSSSSTTGSGFNPLTSFSESDVWSTTSPTSTSMSPPSSAPNPVHVTVTDTSPMANSDDFIVEKKKDMLEFMLAVELGAESPGFMVFRKWSQLEKLDSQLQKAFPQAGTKDFPRAFLPGLKYKKSQMLCDGISSFLTTLLTDERYAESELVLSFFDKQNISAQAKPKLFENTTKNLTAAATNTAKNISSITSDTAKNISNITAAATTLPKKLASAISEASPATKKISLYNLDGANHPGNVNSSENLSYSVDGVDKMSLEMDRPLPMPRFTEDEPEEATITIPQHRSSSVEHIHLESPTHTKAELSNDQLGRVLTILFSLMEEAYSLKGAWTVRRGFFRVLERVVRGSYSAVVKRSIEDCIAFMSDPQQIAKHLSSFRESFWPNNVWYSSVAGYTQPAQRTDAERKETREEARKLILDHTPKALSAALGDAATRAAMESVFQLFQQDDFCVEFATSIIVELAKIRSEIESHALTIEMKWTPIIGLEIHLQLPGRNLFSQISPSVHSLGLPGSLPLQSPAPSTIRRAVRLALALKCDIVPRSQWHRKHYSFPDLAAGYQITQLEGYARNGTIAGVRVDRCQLEQDTANTTDAGLDFERSGKALVEIVLHPDIRSSQQAVDVVKAIRNLARRVGATNAEMENGTMRCDVNINVRSDDRQSERVEVKNLNSLKAIKSAIEYEVGRHVKALETGELIKRETRSFNSNSFQAVKTISSRGKNLVSGDYRCMIDPNLPDLVPRQNDIQKLNKQLPELHEVLAQRLVVEHNVPLEDANRIVMIGDADQSIEGEQGVYLLGLDFFNCLVRSGIPPSVACNWLCTDLLGALNQRDIPWTSNPMSAQVASELLAHLVQETITRTNIKILMNHLIDHPEMSLTKAIEHLSVLNTNQIEGLPYLCRTIVEANPSEAEAVRRGNPRVISKLIGILMKQQKGRINASAARKIFEEILHIPVT